MQTTICDVKNCGKPIATIDIRKVTVKFDGEDPYEYDICKECFTSPLILSEMRRTRTRKKPAKTQGGRKRRGIPDSDKTAKQLIDAT